MIQAPLRWHDHFEAVAKDAIRLHPSWRDKICPVCRKTFTATYANARYCTPTCGKAAHRAKKRSILDYEGDCARFGAAKVEPI